MNHKKTSVWTVFVPAEITTRNFQNKSLGIQPFYGKGQKHFCGLACELHVEK
jgi:2-keto-4-pentenoate hydratase/2-oxohepta-3-ene-1,7-dioic acid hydratase in catechol pathway